MGVIAKPGFFFVSIKVIRIKEVLEFQIERDDKILIIASDGVWEFLPNENVMHSVIPFYENKDINGACRKLVMQSTSIWKRVIQFYTFKFIYLGR